MTKSKIFFFFCLSFIFGIFLGSVVKIPLFLMGIFLILGIILIAVSKKNKRVVVAGFCLMFLILGIWRYQIKELEISNNQLRRYNDSGQEITLIGAVVKEPDIREKSRKLTIKLEDINSGKILLTTWKYPEYRYGDKLKIIGKLETPLIFEDFNYKNYLAKEGIYSVVYFPEIKFLGSCAESPPLSQFGRGAGSPGAPGRGAPGRGAGSDCSVVYAGILGFKDKLRKSIYQNLPPPQSSILGAMVLGDKSRMDKQLKEKLNTAGVRHITAVSGLHITIISSILMSLLLGLGFYRNQAFYISIILIFLFIIMIGAHPSSIRAGIMGGLYLLGQRIGRKSVSVRSIVFAAAFMLSFNPLLLLYDVGFQLSFLAVTGIIYLRDSFNRLFRFLKIKWLRDIISMTLSAQVFTIPILVYNFGRISLIAPLTNILILPVVPFIMLLGFGIGLLGILGELGELGAWIFALLDWFLLTYLLKVVDFFSQNWSAITIENVHWFWLIIPYLFLGYLVWHLNSRKKFPVSISDY